MSTITAPGLRAALARILRRRIVIMGIGNPMRGDDAVGCAIVQQLRRLARGTRLDGPDSRLTLLDVEEIPESWLGPAVQANPDVVLLIDAVDLHAPAGSAALLPARELSDVALSTHRTPLAPLARYLEAAAGCDVHLLGVQPASTEWGAALDPDVADAASDLAVILLEIIAGADEDQTSPDPEATGC